MLLDYSLRTGLAAALSLSSFLIRLTSASMKLIIDSSSFDDI